MSWFLMSRNLKLLEPYEGKLSRTVLRGESPSNGADLLDVRHVSCINDCLTGFYKRAAA